MNKFERWFDRFCEKTGFNPAAVLPRIEVPNTIRQIGTRHSREEIQKIREDPSHILAATKVDMGFHSFYELAWLWTHTNNPNGRWTAIWSFLHEASLGVYTPEKYWIPVEVVGSKEELDD